MKPSDITYQDKLDELILDVRHPNTQRQKTVFILVEGKTDVRLFRKLLDTDKFKIEYIPGGKVKLEEALNHLLRLYVLMAAIRDADFLHLTDEDYEVENIFLTDEHDMEMMLLAQKEVLNALFFEYTDVVEREHISKRDELLEMVQSISCLKWLNDLEILKLKFEKVDFQHLIDFDNQRVDVSSYIQNLLSRSPNAKIKELTVLQSKVNDLIAQKPDLLQVTNGHDAIKVLTSYFKKRQDQKGLNYKTIESAIRIAFTVETFQKTKLYQQLRNWLATHQIEV